MGWKGGFILGAAILLGAGTLGALLGGMAAGAAGPVVLPLGVVDYWFLVGYCLLLIAKLIAYCLLCVIIATINYCY